MEKAVQALRRIVGGRHLDPVFTVSRNGQLRSLSHMASKAQAEDGGLDGLIIYLLHVSFNSSNLDAVPHRSFIN